jgi:NADH:ubiquinone oxidoreductase subunit 6 (subunit J)
VNEYFGFLLLGMVVGVILVGMELRNLKNSALLLCAAFILLGVFYGLLGATYVMILQLLIYGGAVIALLLTLLYITRGEYEE